MSYINKAPTVVNPIDCDNDFTFAQAHVRPKESEYFQEEFVVQASSITEKKCLTPREIIEEAIDVTPDSVGACVMRDSQLLGLFKKCILELYTLNGDEDYNFTIKKTPINIVAGVETYKLPSDYRKRNGLWYVANGRNYEFLYRQRVSWMNEPQKYIYTTEGDNLLIRLPNWEKREKCGSCGVCECCKDMIKEVVTLEYYSLPPVIKDIDEAMCYLSDNVLIREYLIETMVERLHSVSGKMWQSPYKSSLRNQILKWDQDKNPVDNKPKGNRHTIKISKW